MIWIHKGISSSLFNCLDSGDFLILAQHVKFHDHFNDGILMAICWDSWLRFLHLAAVQLCPGSFLRSGSICGLLSGNVFHHFKTWKNLETWNCVQTRKTHQLFQLFQEKSNLWWKQSHKFGSGRKDSWNYHLCRLSGKHWWKFGLQGCDLATPMQDLDAAGSAMKVTYSNLKSSLGKEDLHEKCQCFFEFCV